MQNNFKLIKFKLLYISFIFITLIKIFFSTGISHAIDLNIKNVEVSKPFQINFDKNEAIDEGFNIAFRNLMTKIIMSTDQKKVKDIPLSEIKGMIDMFSIKEEKFIKNNYYVNLDVSFNKNEIFSFLEEKNIFPSAPSSKKLLLIPILIDENNVFLFSNNIFYNNWNLDKKKNHLLDYILPSEDLEHIQIIEKNFMNIEQYDFKEIISKYSLKDFIIVLIFKDKNTLRVLSKINLDGNISIDNNNFEEVNLENKKDFIKVLDKLQATYEDYWKQRNQLNTSIKLPLTVSININNNIKINNFENILSEIDLISNFFIYKFDNKKIFYKIIFNGSPKKFLNEMKNNGLEFDTQKKVWNLK